MDPANRNDVKRPRPRPISPHLQVHSFPINMVMSILHRMTGAALYFGTLLLAAWLISAAIGPQPFTEVNAWFDSVIGRTILIGYTWALIHHMLGGIRHLIWDTGQGLDIRSADLLCWGSIVLSLVLTAAIWIVSVQF